MVLTALLVGIAQLIVAIIAPAAIRPRLLASHRTHHRPPNGGLLEGKAAST